MMKNMGPANKNEKPFSKTNGRNRFKSEAITQRKTPCIP